MLDLIYHCAIVVLPLILSGVLHMIVVKKDILPEAKNPISAKTFGENKTWRGVIVMAGANGIFLWLINFVFGLGLANSLEVGAKLGLAYMLFELPNSYMKRRLGISSGDSSTKNKRLFQFIDKTDSALGVSLIYLLMGYVDWKMALGIFGVAVVSHIILSKVLVMLKIKANF